MSAKQYRREYVLWAFPSYIAMCVLRYIMANSAHRLLAPGALYRAMSVPSHDKCAVALDYARAGRRPKEAT